MPPKRQKQPDISPDQLGFEIPTEPQAPSNPTQALGQQALTQTGIEFIDKAAVDGIEMVPRDQLEAGYDLLKSISDEDRVWRFVKGAAKGGSIRQKILKDKSSSFYRDTKALDEARRRSQYRVEGLRRKGMEAYGLLVGITTYRDSKGYVHAVDEAQQGDLGVGYTRARMHFAGEDNREAREELMQDIRKSVRARVN